ncbi:MAG: HNH endonuclease [Actinobacteria bacterium]|nr:HNH endonuclease [Actinomycetota bacterium]MBU4217802.1 HNH endonuclease [Actinomycetota bacterium]MBU4359996.1 HNH endonuclease [Actinomycetota bacterium]MBU4391471.1 HNH endonuclease [Actinomycetota bacterium]MBU4403819.1 HNH endonuclease [Actinomycetota bacterium]
MRGEPLMPTSPRRARILLGEGKARVVKRTPFVIQLLYPTGETAQAVTLGVDAGYSRIGVSAVSEGKELYSLEMVLRSDMVKLNSERKMYRRNRRGRKCWHRKPRFLNRVKPKGWLAPSIQHKLYSHVKVVEQTANLLPVSKVIVEVANFDIQKIKNLDIEGEQYQQGDQYGFGNIREYVFFRDGHKCQHCRGKSKDPILQTHHITSRQVGGDRPDNLLTVCKTCHDAHNRGEITIAAKPKMGYKAETFMTTVRWKIIEELEEIGYAVSHTYGHITKHLRIESGLPKSHTNDAFVIAGGNGQIRTSSSYTIKQVRSNNRKLYKGARSHIKNTAPRYLYRFQRYDKVLYNGIECFIFGRRSSGYFDVRKVDGTKVHSSVAAGGLILLESAKTLLTERRTAAFLPHLKEGVGSRL